MTEDNCYCRIGDPHLMTNTKSSIVVTHCHTNQYSEFLFLPWYGMTVEIQRVYELTGRLVDLLKRCWGALLLSAKPLATSHDDHLPVSS